MKKKWVKNADFNYSLWVDEKETGKMQIQFNPMAGKANCTMHGMAFTIQRTGFWKSNIEITDTGGAHILSAHPEKWYANHWNLEFENKKYKLLIRNNPLAEYAVTESEKDILAYGLASENRKISVRISTSGQSNLLFDFLLWYLFMPIANENFGDAYSFLISHSL